MKTRDFVNTVQKLILFSAFFLAQRVPGSSQLNFSPEHQIASAEAIFHGVVVDLQSFEGKDGGIFTRGVIQVSESFKGKVPKLVHVVHRGGTLPDRGEMDGASPHLKIGDERLFLMSRRADGTIFARGGVQSALPVSATKSFAPENATGQNLLAILRSQTAGGLLPGADVTDQASVNEPTPQALQPQAAAAGFLSSSATNLLLGNDSLPARFILPDRAESIPYLIDADFLPAGITQTQAVNAVKSALAAWTNATSVRYVFSGIQSFGQAAANVAASDGALRIQLHDIYHYIGGSAGSGNVLGQGGHAWTISNRTPGWTTGGNVNGNDFHKATKGYVVLAHTNTFMQNLASFTEVLTHEIGHTIGLDHSSENSAEANPILKQAIMFYTAHGDGRGASLNSFDTNTARQVHPVLNTPPYLYDRMLDADSSPMRPLNIPGVNSAQMRGYDLQGGALTFATTDSTANNGTFSVVSSNITFVPAGWFPDSPRLDPSSTSAYDRIYARYSDGVNASPYVSLRVIGLYEDDYNEGIPDSWRTTYFENPSPSAGANHHAGDDADGDGYSNLTEWLLGSNPTVKNSNLLITSITKTNLQFTAKPYEVYEVYASTNLTTWARAINPIVPTGAVAAVTNLPTGAAKQFFRVSRVP